MQLVDYSDSEPDEPVPSSVRLPRVVAAEQENSTGRAAGRATVAPLHPTLVEPASAGSADKPPPQNVRPLRHGRLHRLQKPDAKPKRGRPKDTDRMGRLPK